VTASDFVLIIIVSCNYWRWRNRPDFIFQVRQR